jgi:neurotransmitter:Na+ symporter, NSS family
VSNKPSGGSEQWATRIGVILAVAGSAVGLGNFLRFPGQAAQNGGGAFMVPYFISLLVLGIPLCWAEWTLGRYGGGLGFNSAPGIYSTIWRHRFAKYLGALALLVPLIIYMYYVLIEAWCLGYAFNYLTGDLLVGKGGEIDRIIAQAKEAAPAGAVDVETTSQAFKTFFDNFVGKTSDGFALGGHGGKWLWVLVAIFTFNFFLIYRGVTKGIERFCQVAMPLMAVLAMIVLVRVLTLGTPDPAKPDQSVLGGLNFMWNPDFRVLKNPEAWLDAAGQIFFSLSVGFGIIVNYASYLKKEDDIALSGLTSSSVNEFFEVCLGGMITLPVAFIFLGAAATDFTGSAFALGFNALPNVFTRMWGGQLFGFLWYFVLFIAAVTSSVSMLQPVIAFLEEGFGLRRHASAAFLGLITALGVGFVLYFSKDLVALDTMDFWVGSVFILLLALVQSLLYGWALGIKRGDEELHRGAHIRIPRFVQYMLKYVVPLFLLAILSSFCFQTLPSSDAPLKSSDDANVTLSEPTVAALAAGEFPKDLRSRLAELDVELPEEVVVAAMSGGHEIRSADNRLLLIARQKGDDWLLLKHNAGYIENALSSQATSMTLAFIAAIVAFLLLMVHIAGRRWEAEGRLTYGPTAPQEPA